MFCVSGKVVEWLFVLCVISVDILYFSGRCFFSMYGMLLSVVCVLCVFCVVVICIWFLLL